MALTTHLTRATLDWNDPEQVRALAAQEGTEAAGRVHRAVAEMQREGILDASGRLVRHELPDEMREGSDSDLSAV